MPPTYQPPGEKGPHAGRSLFRLKVEPHRATTDTLSVAYPFLAEAGLGSEGALIGHDSWSGAAFCFDVWNLYDREVITNPNMLLAGIIGRGKSALAKSLSTRSIAFGRKVYVPGDPKGEWTPVARAVDGASIALGPGMTTRINPLDEGPRPAYWIDSEGGRQPMDDEMWRSVVTNRRRDLVRALTEQALGRDLQSVEMTALFAAVDAVVRGAGDTDPPAGRASDDVPDRGGQRFQRRPAPPGRPRGGARAQPGGQRRSGRPVRRALNDPV